MIEGVIKGIEELEEGVSELIVGPEMLYLSLGQ